MWMPITAYSLRDIFRTQSNFCDGAFSVKIVYSLLQKTPSCMSKWNYKSACETSRM